MRIVSLGIATLCFCAVALAAEVTPKESRYLITKECGFNATPNDGVTFFIHLSIKMLVNHSRGWFAVYEFENPEASSRPVRVVSVISALQSEIVVKSPTFNALQNNRSYKVTVKLYEDSSEQKLLAHHVDFIPFKMTSSEMRSYGIHSI